MARLLLKFFLLGSIVLSSTQFAHGADSKNLCFAYFGTYTNGSSKGIYHSSFDQTNGALGVPEPSVQDALKNPSFLAVHPSGKYLYAVSEQESGSLWAFKIDGENGELKLINQVSTGGSGPCFVSLDATGTVALVANYNDGSVASFSIREDGSLGPLVSSIKHSGRSADPKRQAGPHAHSILVSPDNRFAVACDLGTDKLIIYKLNTEKAKLSPSSEFEVRPGSGPRHMAFSKDGRFLYVANELSNSIAVYSYDASRGKLNEEVQLISTIPNPDAPNTVAEIQIDPSGRFLFCSNRGEDSIAVYAIDPVTGSIKPAAYQKTKGQTPRNFSIDPGGNFVLVANQASATVFVFKIDLSSGKLLQIEEPISIPEPVCVKFVRKN